MRRARIARLLFLVILAIGAIWWRSQRLTVQRTIVASFPSDINRLIVTDLNEDGENELLAFHSVAPLKTNPVVFSLPAVKETEPETWLIHSPLKEPRLEKLPYAFRLPLPQFLPPLRRVLVERFEKNSLRYREVWQFTELGWLMVRGGKFVFEPLASHKGKVRCCLATVGSIVNIGLEFEELPEANSRKHFGFRISHDGDWEFVNFKGWEGTRLHWYGAKYFGDFNGDGIVDLLKFSHAWNKPSRLEIYWGTGERPSLLLERRALSSDAVVDDLDGDGVWEIVTEPLTIWKFLPDENRFALISQLRIKVPSLPSLQRTFPLPSQTRKSSSSTLSSPPKMLAAVMPPVILGEIAPVDLDGDGSKEFMLFWFEPRYTDLPVPPPPPPQPVAVQVLWREGQSWQVKEFKPPETQISGKPIAMFTLKGQRYAIATEVHTSLRLKFRFISLRPLRLQLFERTTKSKFVLFRLPEGKDSFDLMRWQKVGEVPFLPFLCGDWDGDGKVEFLMRQSEWSSHYYSEPKPTNEILYIAQFDGRKVKTIKLLPPKPFGAAARISSIAIVKGQNEAAIFVLWDRTYESVLERLRWH